MKKYIIWTLIVAFIVGSVILGGPFNLIDFILVGQISGNKLGLHYGGS